MKKKSKKVFRIKKLGHKPFALITFLASVLVIGAFVLPSNLLNQSSKNTPPHIDSISPTIGRPDALITITGSGFTTQQENETKIKNVTLPPGNYLRHTGSGTEGPPTFSPDGKTLKFQLISTQGGKPKNCAPGETGKNCQISLQVVNGNGVPSNIVQFQVYIPKQDLAVSMDLDSQNPPDQNIHAGAKDVEILRFRMKAAADNYVNVDITDFFVKTVPTYWSNYYCKDFLGDIKIFDVSSGELLGGYYLWPSADGSVYCGSAIHTWLSIPPGVEKTLSIKLSIAPQAKAGLQFRISADDTPHGIDFAFGQIYFTYGIVTSNLITIVAP